MTRPDRDWTRDLEELYRMPGHLLRRANQAVVAIFYEKCQGLNVTPVQFASMTAIAAEGSIDATRLSDLIGFDRATLGSVLDRLERRGLILRTPHPIDRRVKQVSLTEEGKRLLSVVRPLVEQSQETFVSVLTAKERADFEAILRKLVLAHPARDSTRPSGTARRAFPGQDKEAAVVAPGDQAARG